MEAVTNGIESLDRSYRNSKEDSLNFQTSDMLRFTHLTGKQDQPANS